MEDQNIEKRLKKLEETEEATCDIVRNLQITMNTIIPMFDAIKEGIRAIPTDYVKFDDVEKVITEYMRDKRIYLSSLTAHVSEKDMGVITGLKDEFTKVEKDIKEDLSTVKPRKPLLGIVVADKYVTWLSLTAALFLVAMEIYLFTSPMFIAHREYEDNLNAEAPEYYYNKAYTKASAGETVFSIGEGIRIKTDEEINKEMEEYLKNRWDREFCVYSVEFGHHKDKLVKFRPVNNDITRTAYFGPDGNIYITKYQKIKNIYDARKMLTSEKVEWEEVER